MTGDDLSVDALVSEAAARTGQPVGGLPFLGTLERLVESCRRTAALNDTGTTVLHKAAVRHLRNLIALQSYVEAHPSSLVTPLRSAVVITGLPRTGTTLLHNLLAADPSRRVLRLWEALAPVPSLDPRVPPPSDADQRDRAARWLEAFYGMVPEFRTIHAATPDGPEECDALLQNSFASQHFDDMFDARDYSAWLATAGLDHEYRHYAQQLRVLSASSPPGTIWALKSPSHLGHLDALRRALPGCTVVVCHRHPRQAVASYASLILALRRPYSAGADPAVVGRQALQRSVTAVARAQVVRDEARPGSFVDVSYPRLVADPVGTASSLYDQLGRPAAADVVERMGRWAGANPQHQHGLHRYDLSTFGLTEAEVDAAFAGYLDRYGALVRT